MTTKKPVSLETDLKRIAKKHNVNTFMFVTVADASTLAMNLIGSIPSKEVGVLMMEMGKMQILFGGKNNEKNN